MTGALLGRSLPCAAQSAYLLAAGIKAGGVTSGRAKLAARAHIDVVGIIESESVARQLRRNRPSSLQEELQSRKIVAAHIMKESR